MKNGLFLKVKKRKGEKKRYVAQQRAQQMYQTKNPIKEFQEPMSLFRLALPSIGDSDLPLLPA